MKDEDLLVMRLAVIQRIVTLCDDVGKTKIQKIVYFLQEAVSVPLGYSFRMHYYGPYSDELDGVLSLAKSVGKIDITPDPNGFGYHVTMGQEIGRTWLKDYDVSKELKGAEIDGAINTLGALETFELELYATIHFIGGPESRLFKEKTLRTVRRLKPKFTADRINHAYRNLQEAGLI